MARQVLLPRIDIYSTQHYIAYEYATHFVLHSMSAGVLAWMTCADLKGNTDDC